MKRVVEYTLTVLLASALIACGGGADGKATDSVVGGEEDGKLLVSYPVRGTLTVKEALVPGEETTHTVEIDPSDKFTRFGRCVLNTVSRMYGIELNAEANRYGFDVSTVESYGGPGTYQARDKITELACILTVNQGERSGAFSCNCTRPPTECDLSILSADAQFECLGEWNSVF